MIQYSRSPAQRGKQNLAGATGAKGSGKGKGGNEVEVEVEG